MLFACYLVKKPKVHTQRSQDVPSFVSIVVIEVFNMSRTIFSSTSLQVRLYIINLSIFLCLFYLLQFEASVPVNDSNAIIDIEGVRLSRVGFNMPHVQYISFSDPSTQETVSSAINILKNILEISIIALYSAIVTTQQG